MQFIKIGSTRFVKLRKVILANRGIFMRFIEVRSALLTTTNEDADNLLVNLLLKKDFLSSPD